MGSIKPNKSHDLEAVLWQPNVEWDQGRVEGMCVQAFWHAESGWRQASWLCLGEARGLSFCSDVGLGTKQIMSPPSCSFWTTSSGGNYSIKEACKWSSSFPGILQVIKNWRKGLGARVTATASQDDLIPDSFPTSPGVGVGFDSTPSRINVAMAIKEQ